jgi:hypothetical protein
LKNDDIRQGKGKPFDVWMGGWFGGRRKWVRSECIDVTSLALPKHTPCRATAADMCESSAIVCALCDLCKMSNCESQVAVRRSRVAVTSISAGGVGEEASARCGGSERPGPPVFPRPGYQGPYLLFVTACQALQNNQKFHLLQPLPLLAHQASNVSQLGAVLALYGSCGPLPPTAAGSLWLTPLWAAGSALGGGPLINSHSAAEGWIGLRWESCACCTCILTSFWAGEGLPVHCYSESLSYHGRTVV